MSFEGLLDGVVRFVTGRITITLVLLTHPSQVVSEKLRKYASYLPQRMGGMFKRTAFCYFCGLRLLRNALLNPYNGLGGLTWRGDATGCQMLYKECGHCELTLKTIMDRSRQFF